MKEFPFLPEPAGSLWNTFRDPLEQEILEFIPDFSGWKLSGGTILSAQWNHRKSTDIDLKVRPYTDLPLLNPDYNPRFSLFLESLGVTTVFYRTDQVTMVADIGKIDIFAAASVPSVGEYTAVVHDRKEEVLSNSQILTGKISGRGLRSPTRDLFDIAVAFREDPLSLSIATNTVHRDTFREIVARIKSERLYYREDAQESLMDVPSRWQHILENPAEAALEALLSVRYKRVCIHWENHRLRLSLEFRNQQRRNLLIDTRTSKRLEYDLERLGLNHYLKTMRWGLPLRVKKRIDQTEPCRNQVIFESNSDGFFFFPE